MSPIDLLKAEHTKLLQVIEMSQTHAVNYADKSEEFKREVLKYKEDAAELEAAIKRLS